MTALKHARIALAGLNLAQTRLAAQPESWLIGHRWVWGWSLAKVGVVAGARLVSRAREKTGLDVTTTEPKN
jgi:hypothetical protein